MVIDTRSDTSGTSLLYKGFFKCGVGGAVMNVGWCMQGRLDYIRVNRIRSTVVIHKQQSGREESLEELQNLHKKEKLN